MWRQRKTWEGPKHPWQKLRILEEKKLLKEYGLKNKREIWKAETIARKIRKYARYLNAKKALGFDISKEAELFLKKLKKYGFIPENANLDDVLNVTVRDILERRLQTLVWKKGLAKTIKQARQLITHGHIVIGDRVVDSPGYLVLKEEEDLIRYHPFSPLADQNHPLRIDIEKKNKVVEENAENKE